MKKFITFLVLVVLGFSIYYFFFRNTGPSVQINDQRISVEIADQPEEQRLGLMNRETLAQDAGMLFTYPEPKIPSFWMKNMKIPLDIIFMSSDKTINHIEKNVPPCKAREDGRCEMYGSPKPSQYILEVNSGYADQKGFKVGDQVEFSEQW